MPAGLNQRRLLLFWPHLASGPEESKSEWGKQRPSERAQQLCGKHCFWRAAHDEAGAEVLWVELKCMRCESPDYKVRGAGSTPASAPSSCVANVPFGAQHTMKPVQKSCGLNLNACGVRAQIRRSEGQAAPQRAHPAAVRQTSLWRTALNEAGSQVLCVKCMRCKSLYIKMFKMRFCVKQCGSHVGLQLNACGVRGPAYLNDNSWCRWARGREILTPRKGRQKIKLCREREQT